MVEAAFYGDDFTGSTDALAQFARVGLRAALLVTVPTAAELKGLGEQYDVIGVAGITRSLAPDAQEAELRPILRALRDLGPRVVQYKVCSTADSSPTRGSIGRALELGREIFGPAVVPILVAQPELGRYTLFSHHFAAEAGTVYRLDRQPTMSTHPTTPMAESDLRLHLGSQTALDITALHRTTYADLRAQYDGVARADAVVLDALTDADLEALGRVILPGPVTEDVAREPRFVIGSGGLSRALALNLLPTADRELAPAAAARSTGPALVVSGSQSSRTAEQINHAAAAGWPILPLTKDTATTTIELLQANCPGIVVHTNDLDPAELSDLPAALAHVIRRATESAAVRRVIVAGGDTSGQVLRHLAEGSAKDERRGGGITALELVRSDQVLAPGVHLCRVRSADPSLDSVEILLKPGQLGGVDLFTTFQRF
jgi:3-oxoisoapionate kinase